MGILRTLLSAVLSKGVLSAGWNAIWTGLAMLYVAVVLGSATGDPAAPFVSVVLALAGLWQLERGVRAEFQRRRKPSAPGSESS